MNPDVVVCGAGVGGLAAARALSALGRTVLVLDRRAEPTEVAKGELLQPESVRILDAWGVLPALRDGGAVPVDRLAIRDPRGRALLDIDYGTLPGEYRQILCTEYVNVLAALEANLDPTVEIRRGVLVEETLHDEPGRVIGVRVIEGDHRYEIAASLVIAADGLSSRLRKASGLTADRDEYDHKLIAFDVHEADVAPEVTAYRTDDGLRLVYPLPGGRARVYVQVRPDEFRGSGTADLTGWIEYVITGLPNLAPIADRLRESLHTRQLLAVQRLRAPRLTTPGLALIGEAAHAVHPMAAQGMNSSLADAETLADHLSTSDSVDAALDSYHPVRLARLDHTATVSHNAARMLTSTAGLAKVLGRRMMRHTSANPRLLRVTAGNMSGIDIRPLSTLDRFYQFGLLPDRNAKAVPGRATTAGGVAR